MDCCDKLCRKTTEWGLIYSFTSFSHFHTILIETGTYSWHGAFHPFVIPGAKSNMICWGKLNFFGGKIEQKKWGKWHTLTNMMTSSNGNIFRVTDPLCGEFTGHRWIPHTKASDADLWCFLWCALNKRLNKQSRGWWFQTPSRPLWRHSNERMHGQSTGNVLIDGFTSACSMWGS